MSVGTLSASLLGNILPGKEVVRADRGESRARKQFQCGLTQEIILRHKEGTKVREDLRVFVQ